MNGTGGTLEDYMESPVSDGTIEENFEEQLENAPQEAQQNDKEIDNLSNDVNIIYNQ